MVHTAVRVLLAAVWLAVAGVLFIRGPLLPAEWVAGKDALTLNFFALIALVLAVYNVLRLVAYLRRRRARARLRATNPLSRPRPDGPKEYIPELDFTGTGPPERVQADEKPIGEGGERS